MDMWTFISGALAISMVMALAGVGLTAMPAWRLRAVEIIPVILAVASFAVSGYFIVTQGIGVGDAFWGIVDVHWLGLLAGSVTGILLAIAAFWLEAHITRRWYSNRAGHDMYFLYMPVAGRSETMTAVAGIAQRSQYFAVLSLLSASGEEFFYRGVFLLGGTAVTHGTLAAFLLVQALLYGINHVAFGVPAVAGKCLLGVSLGVTALLGGIPASLIAHLFYQVLVLRQFRGKERVHT